METCDPIGTPMEIKDNLDLDQNGSLVDATKYRSMIGALMYLTSSRPDIVHATCLCARYQAKPTEKHLKEVKRIFCYLRGTINMGIWYTKDSGFELIGFSYADYAGCKDTFKSTSGGTQFLGKKLVSWSSKKQDCTTLSIAKAEYVSLSACCAQNRRDLPRNTLLDRVEVLGMIEKRSKVRMGIMLTEAELALEQSQQGMLHLPRSTKMNLRDHVKSISTTVETDTTHLYDDCCDEEEGSYGLKDFDTYSVGTTLLDDALPPKEKDLGSFTLPCYINNLCFNNTLADLGASVSVMPFSTYTNLGLGIDKFVFPVDFIVLDMPEDIKTPFILGRPFLSIAHAKIDVFKRKITLKVRNDKVVFKSDKPTSNIIKRVYALSLRERMELDLEARLMGKTLILNRSLDPLYGDYIKLNDLNEPLELKRNRFNDSEPTIEEGGVVDEPMMDIVKTRCDDEIIDGLDEYLNYEHGNANFIPFLFINVMSKIFYNSIMKDKVEYKGKNVARAFMNVPIFVGNFSVMAGFALVENMDSYNDEGLGDIIVRRPFCREARIKSRRFDGMITIYKRNDSMTYQMA
ncbi:ribonuclease H-like domain, reverse transcriptase, RNA-dependent DNA polymerase [Tanacetum coccineum]